MDINWPMVSEIFFDKIVDVILGGLAGYAVYSFRRRRGNKRQKLLKELAFLRTKGVAQRNLGFSFREMKKQHSAWIDGVQHTEQRIFEFVSELSAAEAQKLATLDKVTQVMVPLSSDERVFVRTFNNFNERLERLNTLIEKYLTPDLGQ